MKKFIYGFLIFFVSLVVLIVVAANSSFIIKKAADAFAPDYNISYSDITGNVFTGVSIDGLKFADMNISRQIRFSWNPSKILYKRIAISEVIADDIDVDSIKALIASFPASEENSTSGSFPLVVTVGKVHVSVNPFSEQGIRFEKTVLDAEDISYASDEVEVGDLGLKLDTNLTDIRLHAALEDGTVKVHSLDISQIDSEALQAMFMPRKSSSDSESDRGKEKAGEISPLIPKAAEVTHFSASLKPRRYLDASIDTLQLNIENLQADIVKILKNRNGAVQIGNYLLSLQSDIGQVKVKGSLANDTVMLDDVSAVKIDTLALKTMFVPDSNETNAGKEENASKPERETVMKASLETNTTKESAEPSALIPGKVIVRRLHTDILPAVYEPVHIHDFAINGEKIVFDVAKLLVEKGELDLNGTTNLTNFNEHSTIKNNHLVGKVVLTPNQRLFDLYELPLRKKAIGDIAIDFSASKERVTVDMDAKAKHILVAEQENNATDANLSEANASKPFNIDINRLAVHADYLIEEKKADAKIDVNVTTPYAKESTLKADFTMNGKEMVYSGALKAGEMEGIDAKFLAPLAGLVVRFKGDEKQVKTSIASAGLKGYFNVPDFTKSGAFHLETTTPVELGKMIAMPEKLQNAKVNAVVDVPLNFKQLVPIKAKAKITSNLANADIDVLYGKTANVTLTAKVPSDSLLRSFDEKIQWQAIAPMRISGELLEKEIKVALKAPRLSADIKMLPFAGTVEGKIGVAGLNATLKGKGGGDIVLKSDVDSFERLLQTVRSFYKVDDLPKVEGKLDASLVLDKNSDATLNLSSPLIKYHADRKTTHDIENVKLSLGTKGSKILLKSYYLDYQGMKFFATKPSEVDFKDTTLNIPQLWLNDQLKVTGNLNTKTMQGTINTNAPTFHVAHEMIDLDSRIDIRSVFEGVKTTVTGDIVLLGGNIHYDMGKKSFASDSDIIIVQEMKKEEASPFMENLNVLVKVNTQKPLIYKQGPVDMKADAELTIMKSNGSDLTVLGDVKLRKGGTYDFQGKRFVVKKGNVYMTGDPNKPLLDIEVEYQAQEHLITIAVSGTPEAPVINFSSIPSLTREQILSVILFDSEEGAGSNSSEDMMKMMGGAMAKSALSNMGVKIDHLVLGQHGNVEIGKKITDKITVIYVNDEVSRVEVEYRHSPRTKSVLKFDEISQSYDIVYRRDMSEDDIIEFVGGKKRK